MGEGRKHDQEAMGFRGETLGAVPDYMEYQRAVMRLNDPSVRNDYLIK